MTFTQELYISINFSSLSVDGPTVAIIFVLFILNLVNKIKNITHYLDII